MSTETTVFRPSPTKPLLLDLEPARSPGFSSKETVRSPAKLPVSCSGCGALTQDVTPGEAGFYTRSRKAVKQYLRGSELKKHRLGADEENGVDGGAAQEGPLGSRDAVQSKNEFELPAPEISIPVPVCDRCHHLIHDSRGAPIAHPTIEDIADSIAESPFTKNHVYHVVDAADFPMSLIPSIHKSLSLAKPRGRNRRAQHSFSSKPSLSFIITRSDLLGPSKEMVDRMMPKFISILRTALGRSALKVRLGNVHLVSSKRGWWTKEIKDSIWRRGGGNWLVGKFNVGKSSLFEVLFPKGSDERAPVYAELQREHEGRAEEPSIGNNFFAESGLLPPPQPEVPFPSMPLVSSLPGTTASPIRLPFGNNKGELIDLPGLQRSGLDDYVQPEHKLDLVMTHRPSVSQYNIKPGQSLLLGGGLVRITPRLDGRDPSTIMMAYPFVPLQIHVTSNEKAIGTQSQERESGIDSILADETGSAMASAGRFLLKTDVTKSRAGSVIRAGVHPEKLPFRIYATDILIEGMGWIELVCQTRKNRPAPQPAAIQARHLETEWGDTPVPEAEELSIESDGFVPFIPVTPTSNATASNLPEVEIFTPGGKFVADRPCLDTWTMWNTGKPGVQTRTGRPRKPMSGAKKQGKKLRRNVSET